MENDTAIDGEVMSESLAIQDTALTVARPPQIVLEEARKAAKALAEVIESKPKKVTFNGRTYLTYEDWQTVARFYGVTAKVVSTQYLDYGEAKGFEARAVALLLSNGMEISAADAMCLNDESKWSTRPKYEYVNGKRTKVGDEQVPLFQLRSMAQTRACAKALRNVLAFVPVLAGYEPTPAEEMDGVEHENGNHVPAKEPTRAEVQKVIAHQESITVSPWEHGNLALTGHGLTILAANVNGGISSFATWLKEAHLWIIPQEDLSKLEGLAKFHSVSLVRGNFPEDEPQKNHEPEPENDSRPVGPVISAVSRKTKKDGNTYLSVRWGESFFSCFDEKLFTYLEKAKGMSAGLLLSNKNDKGYQNIVGIGYIGKQSFHQNQPV